MASVHLDRPKGALPTLQVAEDGVIFTLHNAKGRAFETLALSEDSACLAVVDAAGELVLCNLRSQRFRVVKNVGGSAQHALWLPEVQLSESHSGSSSRRPGPSSLQPLVLGMSDAMIRVYDTVTGDLIEALSGHRGNLLAICSGKGFGSAAAQSPALVVTASSDVALLWSPSPEDATWTRKRSLESPVRHIFARRARTRRFIAHYCSTASQQCASRRTDNS
jgi:hypothetical protein